MSSNTAVELKGSMHTFLSLKLHTSDPEAVGSALADKVQQAPGFFSNTPIVVDLTAIEHQPELNITELLKTIRAHKLIPIVATVLDKDASLSVEQAKAIDIPLVEAGSRKSPDSHEKSASAKEEASPANKSPEETADTTDSGANRSLDPVDLAMADTEVEYIIKPPKLVTRPVRSGQQVYARDTDLIILGQIGAGAEIIADNNIHVYGALRGRALCGVAGNSEARIFCQSLEAELVSVAGNYKVLEEIPAELRGKPAQISFKDDKLRIEPL